MFDQFQTNPQSLKRRLCRGLSGLVAVSTLSVAAPAIAASPTPTVESSPNPSPQLVSLDLDLSPANIIRNAVRLVQVANISNEEEVALGQQISEMILQQYDPYVNPQVNQYVDRVGQQLVAASDRRDIPYTFRVLQSEEINAFATPGGFIYVTTGLLRAADNEAQLASVLAHEIAHVNERHSIQALRRAVLAQGVAETAGLDMNTLAQIGYQIAVDLPWSREFEYEADRVGLGILTNAGYAPIALINFFEKLQDRPLPPEFLRTHPTSENRIEAIAAQIPPEIAYQGQGLSGEVYQRNVSSQLGG
ncbi:MAG: M48 family metallopeptidase [Synechococcales bacterium]|nr:M48 family metallopeptidase [Synechococcales bacterium]